MNLQGIYLQLENLSEELHSISDEDITNKDIEEFSKELYTLACEVRVNYESLRKITGK